MLHFASILHTSQVGVTWGLRVDWSGVSIGMVEYSPQDHLMFATQTEARCAVSERMWWPSGSNNSNSWATGGRRYARPLGHDVHLFSVSRCAHINSWPSYGGDSAVHWDRVAARETHISPFIPCCLSCTNSVPAEKGEEVAPVLLRQQSI